MAARHLFSPFRHCFILCVLTVLSTPADSGTKTDVFIISMLPYQVQEQTHSIWQPLWDDGPDIVPVVRLAVEQINNRTDILSDYTLHLVESDGGCNVGPTTFLSILDSIYDFFENQPIRAGVIGPRCSESSLAAAPLVSVPTFPTIGLHLGMVPTLGSRTLYPNLFGMAGSVSMQAEALIELMAYNDWKRVSILYSETRIDYLTAYQELSRNILDHPEYSITVSLPVYTTYLPLQEIRDSYTRVIIVFLDMELLQQLVCLAYHNELTFPTYQWVLSSKVEGFTETRFYYNRQRYYCSESDIYEAIYGTIALFPDLQPTSDVPIVSGYNYSEYIQQYEDSLKHYSTIHSGNLSRTVWANPLYDATWALALALNATNVDLRQRNLSLADYNAYRAMVTKMVSEHILNTSFVGASGFVSFDRSTGFAIRTQGIYQYVSGSCEYVGYYNGSELVIVGNPMFVSGELDSEAVHVSLLFAICVLVIATVPLLLTVFTQVVSIVYRHFKAIKGSSYRLNQFAYFGTYSVVAGVVLYTVNATFTLDTDTHSALCVLFDWFWSVGLTLILATMCMKTWRLYRIYTASSQLRSIKNPRLITDSALSIGVLALVFLTVVVCVARTIFDRSSWIVVDNDIQGSSPPINYTVGDCESSYGTLWTITLLGYNLVITLTSCIVAMLSHKIEQKGIQVKNVLILSYILAFTEGIGFPLILITNFADYGIVARYAVSVALFIIILYSFVIVLFLPPVILLMRDKWSGSVFKSSLFALIPEDEVRERTKSVGAYNHRPLSGIL